MSDEKVRPNVYEISNKMWVVTTQAGFNKIVKELLSDHVDGFSGYPTKYPSVVTYTVSYRGYFNADIRCVPLTEYINNLKDTSDALKRVDAIINS